MSSLQILIHNPIVITEGDKRRQTIEALEERVGGVGVRLRLNPSLDGDQFNLLKSYGCRFESPTGKLSRSGCLDCTLLSEKIVELVEELWNDHVLGGWQGGTSSKHYFVALDIIQVICGKYEIYIR